MITPLTFDAANVNSNDDAVLYGALRAKSRILKGCAITFDENEIYIASGYMSVCGRQLRVDGTETITVSGTTGVIAYRLVLEVDMDQETETFKVITGTPVQQDISTGSGKYQMELARFNMTITGIESFTITAPRGDIPAAYPVHNAADAWNVEVFGGSIAPSITLPAPTCAETEEIRYIFTAAGTNASFSAPAGFMLGTDDDFSDMTTGNTIALSGLTVGSIYEVSFAVLDNSHIGMNYKEWHTA